MNRTKGFTPALGFHALTPLYDRVVALTTRIARWPAWAGSARWLQAASGVLFLTLAARLAVARLDPHA